MGQTEDIEQFSFTDQEKENLTEKIQWHLKYYDQGVANLPNKKLVLVLDLTFLVDIFYAEKRFRHPKLLKYFSPFGRSVPLKEKLENNYYSYVPIRMYSRERKRLMKKYSSDMENGYKTENDVMNLTVYPHLRFLHPLMDGVCEGYFGCRHDENHKFQTYSGSQKFFEKNSHFLTERLFEFLEERRGMNHTNLVYVNEIIYAIHNGAHRFLEEMSKNFILFVYSDHYIEAIWRVMRALDPDKRFFGERVITREQQAMRVVKYLRKAGLEEEEEEEKRLGVQVDDVFLRFENERQCPKEEFHSDSPTTPRLAPSTETRNVVEDFLDEMKLSTSPVVEMLFKEFEGRGEEDEERENVVAGVLKEQEERRKEKEEEERRRKQEEEEKKRKEDEEKRKEEEKRNREEEEKRKQEEEMWKIQSNPMSFLTRQFGAADIEMKKVKRKKQYFEIVEIEEKPIVDEDKEQEIEIEEKNSDDEDEVIEEIQEEDVPEEKKEDLLEYTMKSGCCILSPVVSSEPFIKRVRPVIHPDDRPMEEPPIPPSPTEEIEQNQLLKRLKSVKIEEKVEVLKNENLSDEDLLKIHKANKRNVLSRCIILSTKEKQEWRELERGCLHNVEKFEYFQRSEFFDFDDEYDIMKMCEDMRDVYVEQARRIEIMKIRLNSTHREWAESRDKGQERNLMKIFEGTKLKCQVCGDNINIEPPARFAEFDEAERVRKREEAEDREIGRKRRELLRKNLEEMKKSKEKPNDSKAEPKNQVDGSVQEDVFEDEGLNFLLTLVQTGVVNRTGTIYGGPAVKALNREIKRKKHAHQVPFPHLQEKLTPWEALKLKNDYSTLPDRMKNVHFSPSRKFN